MLPRWHVFYGFLFTILAGIIDPEISWLYLGLIFFSSIFIDFDHYVCAVLRSRKLDLRAAFVYHEEREIELMKTEEKKGKVKGDFHLFHTIEFQVLIGILGIWFLPFFYLFIGMVFHSLLDLFSLLKYEKLHRREYFFFNWLQKRF